MLMGLGPPPRVQPRTRLLAGGQVVEGEEAQRRDAHTRWRRWPRGAALSARAIAITYTNESGLLREDFSILPSHPPTLKLTRADKDALQDQALALTSTHTLIYAAAPMGGHRFTRFLFRQFQNRWMAENLPDLHPIAGNWESGFEGSWAIMLEPLKNPTAHQPSPNGSMAAILAFPLRNAEATRQALNILSLTSGSGTHESDTQTYTLDPALLPPALVNLLHDLLK